MKNYSDLSKLKTFDERFEYLKLDGSVGADTFGHDRYLNQALYSSYEWKKARRAVLLRDNGCDLGIEDFPISDGIKIHIHHMNPITEEQIINRDPIIFDPEYLITTTHPTHNAIHYGNEKMMDRTITDRKPNDTKLW